jgi:hypothetical protein
MLGLPFFGIVPARFTLAVLRNRSGSPCTPNAFRLTLQNYQGTGYTWSDACWPALQVIHQATHLFASTRKQTKGNTSSENGLRNSRALVELGPWSSPPTLPPKIDHEFCRIVARKSLHAIQQNARAISIGRVDFSLLLAPKSSLHASFGLARKTRFRRRSPTRVGSMVSHG